MSETRLWYTRCPVPTAFGLALQRNLIEDEFGGDPGLAIGALQDSPDRAVRQSHYTHSQPRSFRHGGNYPAIWAQAHGADTRVIGLSAIATRQTILVLPDSPLRAATDLHGKRILLLRRPHEPVDFHYLTGLRTVEKALAFAGLNRHDVTIVEHHIGTAYVDDRPAQHSSGRSAEPPLRKEAIAPWPANLYPLVRGEVDAVVAALTQSVELEYLAGLRPIFDQKRLPLDVQGHNSRPLTFAVKADLIRERPDLVRRVLARALEAETFIRDQPDQALRLFARELAISERVAIHSYGETLVDDLRIDFRDDRVAALRDEVDFLFRAGAIPERIDVDAWLDPSFLDALRGTVPASTAKAVSA
ncbi:hypothetical protein [Sphingomonas colocasiae]|uniref:ABC transporter substrate-binding protein n=1 Tax=Sphingomonas colocasiae TaxID=1848973 RepID=A0ABS7PHJ6_9SPHN|nr:hypothetical protein [Sphingomonas colocasiae]MBY8820763.1 hypothetical protein [Sphingomonas colocasiae]